jgi:tRNA(fMet)-specific endonuclease VapC
VRETRVPVATVEPPDAMALYMLDTDIVSFALRGIGDVSARISERKRSEICISAITLAELRFGAERRGSKKIHRAVEVFVSEVEVLPFDDAAASRFGTVAVTLARSGKPIGQIDTLIAAHALSVDATLVTNNQRHFSIVRGLRLENWA